MRAAMRFQLMTRYARPLDGNVDDDDDDRIGCVGGTLHRLPDKKYNRINFKFQRT